MNKIPAIAFSAGSGVGKTTIIENLIKNLKERGKQVAVIKHDAHDFEIDKEGKDSWRFEQAGADMTILSSENKTAVVEQRHLDLDNVLAMVHDVDLILIEGYNEEHLPRIGVCRKESSKLFRLPISAHIALVTDFTAMELEVLEHSIIDIPIISLNDTEGLTDFILEFIQTHKYRNPE